ncbi:MAG: PKD domain-containing protein [Actinomycetota bacterium]|nr:PKD domain-containing protein [Actinomycetota bacterium]
MRALRTALLLVAGLLLGPGAAVVHAGPGVTIDAPQLDQPQVLPGGQIAAMAGGQRTYTLPGNSSTPGKNVTLGTVAVGSLLSSAGVPLSSVRFVQITRIYGASLIVKPGALSTALVSDDGTFTRYFRSGGASGSGGTLMKDYVENTAATGALEISVNGGADVAVKATATPSRVKVGQTVRFQATVRFSPPGQTYTYEWDFSDGSPPQSGENVEHVYETADDLKAQVSVRNTDPSCSTRCGGVQQVSVHIGGRPEQPKADEDATGGKTGATDGPGSATGTGGGGQGGSGGGGTGTGTTPDATDEKAAAAPKAEPKPPPPARKPFGTTISGVLINDTGTRARKLPAGEPAGAAKGVRAIRGADAEDSLLLALSGLLALAAITVGALRERRGVRLRVA